MHGRIWFVDSLWQDWLRDQTNRPERRAKLAGIDRGLPGVIDN